MDNQVVYTVREFRSKLKEAFEEAESNVDVFVIRGKERFILMTESYYNEILKCDTPPVAETKKVPKQVLCKHGNIKGQCLSKEAYKYKCNAMCG